MSSFMLPIIKLAVKQKDSSVYTCLMIVSIAN